MKLDGVYGPLPTYIPLLLDAVSSFLPVLHICARRPNAEASLCNLYGLPLRIHRGVFCSFYILHQSGVSVGRRWHGAIEPIVAMLDVVAGTEVLLSLPWLWAVPLELYIFM